MSENKVVLLGTKGGPRMEKGLSWSTCSVIEVNGHPYICLLYTSDAADE